MNVAILWDIAPCSPCGNRCFAGKYLHLQGRKSAEQETGLILSHEDRGDSFIRNFLYIRTTRPCISGDGNIYKLSFLWWSPIQKHTVNLSILNNLNIVFKVFLFYRFVNIQRRKTAWITASSPKWRSSVLLVPEAYPWVIVSWSSRPPSHNPDLTIRDSFSSHITNFVFWKSSINNTWIVCLKCNSLEGQGLLYATYNTLLWIFSLPAKTFERIFFYMPS
jgi:hypothetical protein